MTAVSSLLYFVLLIGVLIFVHEAGHFLFAKLFKVKVHAFSLGFGPKLLGFRKGETEYKVSVLPIGGYVKMLGEDPSEDIEPEDVGRAFTDKPLWQRFFIIIGGPLMNMIFPFILLVGVAFGNDPVIPAEVGTVVSDSPAMAAGLLPGDKITAIQGAEIDTFADLVSMVRPSPGKPLTFTVDRNGETLTKTIVPEPTDVPIIPIVPSETETIGIIGISPDYRSSVIGIDDPESPAALAGLESFDKITAVNGEALERYHVLEKRLVGAAGTTVTLAVHRLKKDWKSGEEDEHEDKPATISMLVPQAARSLSDMGIRDTSGMLVKVDEEGAAAAAGLRRGDRLVGVDGEPFSMLDFFTEIRKDPKTARALSLHRGKERVEVTFTPEFIPAGEKKDLGIEDDIIDTGFAFYRDTVSPKKIENPGLISDAIRDGIDGTLTAFYQTFIGFKLLAQRKISFKTMGGPIMIGQLAGMAGREGPSTFISMMALISVNLGILNLLPIPILDGGQLTFIFAEAVRRRPLKRVVKEKIMIGGLVMLLLLMVWVTWNDITRLIVG